MNANETALLDPFEVSTPDEATELTALTRALELAEGFRLLFVRCNQIPQRERLMEDVRARLPKLNIQTIFFREPIVHLLDAVQEKLATPMPDAVFISGLDFSLPVAAEAHATPLIANLNASRNSFAQTLPCPVVLWVPEYVLVAIVQGAPDFFSIRSGVYFFALPPTEIAHLAQNLSAGESWEVASLPQQEKQGRVVATERLLADYEFLPEHQRDRHTELRLLGQLGDVFYAQGNYDKAIAYFDRARKMAEALSDKAGVARSLHQIGMVQQNRSNYEAALDYYQRALKIAEELGNVAGVARSLHQIGMVQQERGNYEAALDYYQRALKIAEELGNVAGVASSQGQLGKLLAETGHSAEAFGLLLNALSTFIQLESPNAGIVANMLKTLRGQWNGFDAAWREAKGSDVPAWLLPDEGAKT
jgi:tetratricopeptide (TPR) repeat protein